MPYNIKNFFLILTNLFFFLIVSNIDVLSENNRDYGDSIIVGSIGDASNLIPMLSSDATSHEIAGLLINGLVKYDKNLNLVGDLARSWNISADGLTITFHLKKGVLWEDGKEFTAEDVIFGFKTITDPKTPTAYAGDFQMVKDISAPDKYTVVVNYKEPFAPALGSWGNIVVLPKHLLEGKDLTTSPLSRKPISLGPYKFKEWTTQEKIVLEANSGYFEGKPFLNSYIMRIIPDSATMFLELKSGNIDWMGLSPLQYSRQTQDKFFNDNFKKYKYLSFSYTYIGYNLKSPLFNEKKVRQALNYAINKEEIVKGVLLGYGMPAQGPYKPDSPFYNKNFPELVYDPDKAMKLLKEAGWKDSDNDGILDKNNIKFSFTILTNQGNDLRLKTAQIIQHRLKKMGIEVKIRTVEWTAFIKDFIGKRRFEAIILGWTMGVDPDIYDIWHSSRSDGNGLNFIGYKNVELDKLLEEGRKTFDIEKRKQIYFKVQEILHDDQPYTFLYYPMSLPIIHKRFKGIEPAPSGITHNFERWYVPKNEQKYITK